ncbi:MAG: sigma-70 family RNA polymerase sigma factor [Candidatus Aminicenantes bacterium]|nr:sigma-70 family RNA polymerase sigma factor [Candidatus Aminicenantes bacterium]
MGPTDDGQTIARCLAGDREAFEMIVNKYQAGVLSLAWSVLGNRAEAEDAAQEAFFRAYVSLQNFDRAKDFKNWLYAIAYKRCLDRIRKLKTEKKYRSRMADALVTSGLKKEPGTEESAILSPLLEKLTVKERLVLSLSINDEYTADEIAEVLQCAVSTARVHLFNAKRKLRKELERNSRVQNL